MFSTTATAVTLVALIGCGSPEVEAPAPAPAAKVETAATTATVAPAREPFKSWSVAINTSGGFSGRGVGGVAATSNGTLRNTGYFGSLAPGPGADLPEESARIAAAIEATDPWKWTASYARASNPEGCCDLYRYTVTLKIERQNGTMIDFTTHWYDDSRENLPPDLRALTEALWNAKKKLASQSDQ